MIITPVLPAFRCPDALHRRPLRWVVRVKGYGYGRIIGMTWSNPVLYEVRLERYDRKVLERLTESDFLPVETVRVGKPVLVLA